MFTVEIFDQDHLIFFKNRTFRTPCKLELSSEDELKQIKTIIVSLGINDFTIHESDCDPIIESLT